MEIAIIALVISAVDAICNIIRGILHMIQGLAKRLQIARINKELSRKQTAELIGVSESLIGLYESGNRQPSLSVLMKLASLYRVSTDYLLGCDTAEKKVLSLEGLTDRQIQAVTLTVQCFKEQAN